MFLAMGRSVRLIQSKVSLAVGSGIEGIRSEVLLIRQFLRCNTFATMVPTCACSVGVYRCHGVGDPILLGKAVVFALLYALCFDLSNQYGGHVEDRINKPHRPIP